MGYSVAVDKITTSFKWRHCNKLRITYKDEGDGFQAYALYDDGYCYQVYMQNAPAPKKYLKQGLSLLHSWTMALFYYLKDDNHQVGMYNLYNSAAFSRTAYHHDHKVLCHGLARKSGKGIPECVPQDEEKNPVTQQASRGTINTDVL